MDDRSCADAMEIRAFLVRSGLPMSRLDTMQPERSCFIHGLDVDRLLSADKDSAECLSSGQVELIVLHYPMSGCQHYVAAHCLNGAHWGHQHRSARVAPRCARKGPNVRSTTQWRYCRSTCDSEDSRVRATLTGSRSHRRSGRRVGPHTSARRRTGFRRQRGSLRQCFCIAVGAKWQVRVAVVAAVDAAE